ncbi:hypothetical protein AHAS_Ahas15G0027800 [Arachis hypogaea]
MWEPNFNPLTASIDKVTAWIRLPGLPIELYDRMVLRKIGNLVGRTIKVDSNTAELSRGKFARMCVEVDLTKPLVGKYLINGREYRVEYEGIHQICFSCGRIDHDQKLCPLKVAQNNVPSVQGEREKELPEKNHMSDERNNKEDGKKLDKGKQVMQESQENFGDWMVVQRPKKGRKGQKAGSSKTKETSTKTENKSRFSVLHIEEVNEETTEGENGKKSEGKKEKEKGKKDNAKGKRVKIQQNKPETQRKNREGKGIGGANNVEQQQHTLNTEHKEKGGKGNESRSMTKQQEKGEHHEENWIDKVDSTQCTMNEGIELSNQNTPTNGRPPDLDNTKKNSPAPMEMKEETEDLNIRLLEGVDFTTPHISALEDAKMDDN